VVIIDFKIDNYLLYVPLKKKFTYKDITITRERQQNLDMIGTRCLWTGRDVCRAATAVAWSLGSSGLIRKTAPFCHLLQHTRGCGESILRRILTGLVIRIPGYGDWKILVNLWQNRVEVVMVVVVSKCRSWMQPIHQKLRYFLNKFLLRRKKNRNQK
jgi:hypothetical protein